VKYRCINISHLTLNTHTITSRIKETPTSLPNSLYSCQEQVRPQARNKQNDMTLPSSLSHQQMAQGELPLLMRNAYPTRRAGKQKLSRLVLRNYFGDHFIFNFIHRDEYTSLEMYAVSHLSNYFRL
jgi:hypothetical protein